MDENYAGREKLGAFSNIGEYVLDRAISRVVERFDAGRESKGRLVWRRRTTLIFSRNLRRMVSTRPVRRGRNRIAIMSVVK